MNDLEGRTARPFRPEIAELLNACTGTGTSVLIYPAQAKQPHHFYAGVARAPALSLLEAILCTLGGRLKPEGPVRYEEIVVVSADRPAGAITPPLSLRAPDGTSVTRDDRRAVWCYRSAPPPAADSSSESPEEEDADSGPRKRRARLGRASRYEAATNASSPAAFSDFDIQVPMTDAGPAYAERVASLRRILETLSSRAHRSLLVVCLDVLDYRSPGESLEHSRLQGDAALELGTLQRWIDAAAAGTSHRTDLVLYSEDTDIAALFAGAGLPRQPAQVAHHHLDWPTVRYNGHNLHHVAWPCGTHPLGDDFTHGTAFSVHAGTSKAPSHDQLGYASRTLGAWLRGQDGARLRMGGAKPTVPEFDDGQLISRAFWSQVDLPGVMNQLAGVFFEPHHLRCLVGDGRDGKPLGLFDAMAYMQGVAREVHSNQAFHDRVKDVWQRSSRLLLWGEGGTGKSFVGKELSTVLFGNRYNPIGCQAYTDEKALSRGLYGSETGLVGSQDDTAFLKQLRTTHGFTVMILDEVGHINKHDFSAGIALLYGILEERTATPNNTQLAPVSMWNTIIIMTANLPSFPPPGVGAEHHTAIRRRMTDYEYVPLTQEEARRFARWYLVEQMQEHLGHVAVCSLGDLAALDTGPPLPLTPSALVPYVQRLLVDPVRSALASAGITKDQGDVLVDLTPFARQALANAR